MTEETKKEETKEEGAESANKADEQVEIPSKFQDIVKQIEEMSVLDLSELVKILEKKFGVSAAAPVAVAATAAPSTEGAAPAEEKSSFNIELVSAGDQKINVIKAIREVTTLGLKEAKDLVEGAPQVIKENVKKEEAEEIKAKLEAAGAKVELK